MVLINRQKAPNKPMITWLKDLFKLKTSMVLLLMDDGMKLQITACLWIEKLFSVCWIGLVVNLYITFYNAVPFKMLGSVRFFFLRN